MLNWKKLIESVRYVRFIVFGAEGRTWSKSEIPENSINTFAENL
jgi:hypothetical protein